MYGFMFSVKILGVVVTDFDTLELAYADRSLSSLGCSSFVFKNQEISLDLVDTDILPAFSYQSSTKRFSLKLYKNASFSYLKKLLLGFSAALENLKAQYETIDDILFLDGENELLNKVLLKDVTKNHIAYCGLIFSKFTINNDAHVRHDARNSSSKTSSDEFNGNHATANVQDEDSYVLNGHDDHAQFARAGTQDGEGDSKNAQSSAERWLRYTYQNHERSWSFLFDNKRPLCDFKTEMLTFAYFLEDRKAEGQEGTHYVMGDEHESGNAYAKVISEEAGAASDNAYESAAFDQSADGLDSFASKACAVDADIASPRVNASVDISASCGIFNVGFDASLVESELDLYDTEALESREYIDLFTATPSQLKEAWSIHQYPFIYYKNLFIKVKAHRNRRQISFVVNTSGTLSVKINPQHTLAHIKSAIVRSQEWCNKTLSDITGRFDSVGYINQKRCEYKTNNLVYLWGFPYLLDIHQNAKKNSTSMILPKQLVLGLVENGSSRYHPKFKRLIGSGYLNPDILNGLPVIETFGCDLMQEAVRKVSAKLKDRESEKGKPPASSFYEAAMRSVNSHIDLKLHLPANTIWRHISDYDYEDKNLKNAYFKELSHCLTETTYNFKHEQFFTSPFIADFNCQVAASYLDSACKITTDGSNSTDNFVASLQSYTGPNFSEKGSEQIISGFASGAYGLNSIKKDKAKDNQNDPKENEERSESSEDQASVESQTSSESNFNVASTDNTCTGTDASSETASNVTSGAASSVAVSGEATFSESELSGSSTNGSELSHTSSFDTTLGRIVGSDSANFALKIPSYTYAKSSDVCKVEEASSKTHCYGDGEGESYGDGQSFAFELEKDDAICKHADFGVSLNSSDELSDDPYDEEYAEEYSDDLDEPQYVNPYESEDKDDDEDDSDIDPYYNDIEEDDEHEDVYDKPSDEDGYSTSFADPDGLDVELLAGPYFANFIAQNNENNISFDKNIVVRPYEMPVKSSFFDEKGKLIKKDETSNVQEEPDDPSFHSLKPVSAFLSRVGVRRYRQSLLLRFDTIDYSSLDDNELADFLKQEIDFYSMTSRSCWYHYDRMQEIRQSFFERNRNLPSSDLKELFKQEQNALRERLTKEPTLFTIDGHEIDPSLAIVSYIPNAARICNGLTEDSLRRAINSWPASEAMRGIFYRTKYHYKNRSDLTRFSKSYVKPGRLYIYLKGAHSYEKAKAQLYELYTKEVETAAKAILDCYYNAFLAYIKKNYTLPMMSEDPEYYWYKTLKVIKMKPLGKLTRISRRISLSVDLAKYPMTCLIAVIAHELTHIVHFNHSMKFKRMVNDICPFSDRVCDEMLFMGIISDQF